ncbi:MAG: LiaF-related protein [Clostridiales bacterium]|nr:LiaF-related protein [Clostridiales bacterium]
MKGKKIFWGIFFILAAVIVIISKMGMIPDVGVFHILITAFMIWMFVEGIHHRNFFEILFSIAFICIIYDEPLGIEALTPWTVLAAALLGSIGLSMLFRGKKKTQFSVDWSDNKKGGNSEQCNGEHVHCENNFGSAIRYINSDNFCNAHLENNFGSMTIYFDNAIIQGASAYVEVENNFGETILYIPKEWKVENHLEHSFGTINEYGRPQGSSNATLHIRGEANFGHIDINYV